MGQQVILNGRMSSIVPDEAVIVNNVARFRPPITNGLMPLDVTINGLTYPPVLEGCVLNLPLYHSALSPDSFRSLDAYRHACIRTGVLVRPDGRLFDGNGDEILIPDHAILDGQAAFSAEAWIYPTASPIAATGILVKRDIAANLAWAIFLGADSTITCNIVDVGGTERSFATTLTAPDNAWSHVLLIWGGTTIKCTINKAIDAGSVACADMIATNADLFVGVHKFGGADRFFTGIIGEVRVYNRAISNAEGDQNFDATAWRYL